MRKCILACGDHRTSTTNNQTPSRLQAIRRCRTQFPHKSLCATKSQPRILNDKKNIYSQRLPHRTGWKNVCPNKLFTPYVALRDAILQYAICKCNHKNSVRTMSTNYHSPFFYDVCICDCSVHRWHKSVYRWVQPISTIHKSLWSIQGWLKIIKRFYKKMS